MYGVISGKGTNLKAAPTAVDPDQVPDGTDADTSFLPVQPEPSKVGPQADPEDTSFLPVQPPKTQTLYSDVSKIDPDHAAKVIDYSKKLDEPPAFVSANIKDIDKAAQGPSPSFFSELEAKYPESTKFLSKPENMAVTHDDLANVTNHEALVHSALESNGFFSRLGQSIKAGYESSSLGLGVRGKMPDVELPPDAPEIYRLADQFAGLISDLPVMAVGGALGTVVGGTAGAVAGGAAGLETGPGALLTAGVGAQYGARLGGSAGAFIAPAIVKDYFINKYTTGGIKTREDFYRLANQMLVDSVKQGTVGIISTLTGGAGGALAENIGARAVAKGLITKATAASAQTAAALGSEITGMTVAGKAVEGQTIEGRDLLEGALMVGAMHGATLGGHALIANTIEGRRAQEVKNFYTALGDTAEASKLRERMPEAHQELIKQLTQDGPVENIYIPIQAVEEYFQGKKLDPATVMEGVGVKDSYEEAKQTGGDVKIPLADWVSKVVGTEHYQGLADDVKFDPEGLTVRQANETKAAVEEQIKLADQKAQDEANAAAPQEKSKPSKIFETISQKLKDAGLSANEAKLNPKLHEAFFNTLAQHLGVDPEELFKRYNLEVQRTDAIKVPGEAAAADLHQGDFATRGETDQTSHPLPEAVNVTSGKDHQSVDVKDLSKLREATNKIAQRGTFVNDHTGEKITVNSESVRKIADQAGAKIKGTRARKAHIEATQHLGDLIKNGIFLTEKADSKGRDQKWRYMFAPLEMNGEQHLVKLQIRDKGNGKFDLYNITTVPDSTGAGPQAEAMDLASGKAPASSIPAESSTRPATEVTPSAANAGTVPKSMTINDFTDRVKSARNAKEFFQSDEEGGARGRIVFGTQGSERRFSIDLSKSADKSTFLHESGHYFLEVLGDVASKADAPEAITNDYNAILKFLGVESKDQIQVEHHEKFAKAFEAYLMEGKAPSEGLRKAFGRFRDWLLGIYKHMKNLDVELTPEFREVMDRMLASKEEIDNAIRLVDYSPDEVAKLSPEVAGRLGSLQEQAREAAESALVKEQLKEITTQNKAFIKEERQRQEVLAKEMIDKTPLFSAIGEVMEGNKSDAAVHAQDFLDEKLHIKDAAKFEEAAETNGFASGEELAKKMIEAKETGLYDKQVQSLTDISMERFAPMKDTGALREEALKAIHSEKMTELLALEKEALKGLINKAEVRTEVTKRNRVTASIEAKAAKEQARNLLSQKSIKDASNARIYITAERNAAVKVSKALAAKDYEAATEFKRQQMLNHALTSEALRNKDMISKSLDYLNQFSSRGRDLLDMPYGFIRQVDSLLSRFGLADPRDEDSASLISMAKDMQGKNEDPADIANATGMKQDSSGNWVPETLPDFVARVNDNYYGLIIPDTVLSGSKPYKEMTFGELKDLQGSVKAIAEVGKKFEKFLGEFELADVKEAARQFRAAVEGNIGTPYADKKKMGSASNGGLKKVTKAIGALTDAMIPDMVNMATLAKYLDGGKNDGFFHQYIYRPLKAAEDRKFGRYQKMTKEIQEMFSQFYTPKELSKYKDKASEVYFPAIDGKLTREQVLSLALNWGNEGNRDRIRRGYNVTDEQVKTILDTLQKKDWDFVQATWDHLDSYWPEISALEMRVNGVEAKRVEVSAVDTKHGEYRGGYYPISYDFEKSAEGYKNAEQKNELYKQFSTAAAHTDSGHAQSRVSTVSRPVRLSLDVLFNHLDNIVHDLEFREPIIDVNRFLRQSEVRAALENTIGIRPTKAIGDWLKAQGSDQGENLTLMERAFQWTRFSTTLSTLGFTPKAFLLHLPSNVFSSAWEIGAFQTGKNLTSAFIDHIMGRGNLKEFVFEKSERMAQRLTVRDRDIMDMAKKWTGAASLLPHYAFMAIHLADEAVSIPLWADVYKRNLEEHGEKKAAMLADEAVTRTLGSGSMVDRIGAQRGGGAKKLFTMFYSWMSVMFNRAWLDGKIAGLEYNKGNVGQAAAIMAKATFYAWLLPAVHEALLGEAMRNSPNNNPDDRNKRIIGKIIEHPFSMMLGARDIAPPLIHLALGERGLDKYQMSPVEQAIQNLVVPAGEAVHIAFSDNKHFDQKFAEDAARGVSQLTGTPQQLNAWAFNLLDWSENNGEATWRDFLSRRKKK